MSTGRNKIPLCFIMRVVFNVKTKEKYATKCKHMKLMIFQTMDKDVSLSPTICDAALDLASTRFSDLPPEVKANLALLIVQQFHACVSREAPSHKTSQEEAKEKNQMILLELNDRQPLDRSKWAEVGANQVW